MLVDSHCHLDFDDFADELPDVIARAREVLEALESSPRASVSEPPSAQLGLFDPPPAPRSTPSSDVMGLPPIPNAPFPAP